VQRDNNELYGHANRGMMSIQWGKIFLSAFLVSIGQIGFSQEPAETEDNGLGLRITTKPLQYIFLDFPVTVEKQYKRHSWSLDLAFRASTSDSAEVPSRLQGMFDSYTIHNYINPLYQAITIGTGYKFFFTKRRKHNWFVGMDMFYRYWWFNNKYSKYESYWERGSFEGKRSEEKHVYGLKILFGKTFIFNVNTRVKPVLEIYGGLGFRGVSYEYQTEQGTVAGDIVIDHITSGSGFLPSFQGGFKVGFGM